MNVFDLIILALLVALTLRGIWKGMVSQIVSVASYIVSWIVASRFGGLVAPSIPVEAPWNQVLAMGIVFLLTLIAIRFGHAALEKLIKNWHLQKLNTLLGGILGFAKGLLLCLIITFFAVMFSETSRAVVFNSKSGFLLVHLITQIGVFVPKDSYEFVHSQLAQFQDKVEGAVPGQATDVVPIQSSDVMKQMLAQLPQTKGTSESKASSLWTALSQWWSGTKEDETPEAEVVTALTLPIQDDTPNQPLEATYTLPPSAPFVSQASSYSEVPLSATQPTVAAEDFFIQRPESVPMESPQLTALLPSHPEVPPPLAPLTSLTPLSEILSMLPESEQLLPILSEVHHVGSDMLLRNSGLPMNPNTPARVFRPQ